MPGLAWTPLAVHSGGVDAHTIATEIRRRLGARASSADVLAELERVVAEHPTSVRVRVAVELELLRSMSRVADSLAWASTALSADAFLLRPNTRYSA